MFPPTRTTFVIFYGFLSLVVLYSIWGMMEPTLYRSEVVETFLDRKETYGCFEFWLNRYQQLLAGVLALLAAAGAAYLVWRQFEAMESGRIVSLENILVQRSREMAKIEGVATALERAAHRITHPIQTIDWSLGMTLRWVGFSVDSLVDRASTVLECHEILASEAANFTGGPNVALGVSEVARNLATLYKEFQELAAPIQQYIDENGSAKLPEHAEALSSRIETLFTFGTRLPEALRNGHSLLMELVLAERRKISDRLIGIEAHIKL